MREIVRALQERDIRMQHRLLVHLALGVRDRRGDLRTLGDERTDLRRERLSLPFPSTP